MSEKREKRKSYDKSSSSTMTDTSSEDRSHRYLTWSERPMDAMNFVAPDHSSECLIGMNSLRAAKKLCDITLKVGKDKIVAHKLVLASASPYFHAMFTCGMKEESSDVVKLRGIPRNILSILVTFCYTSQLTITPVNVWELLPAAMMLQMNTVINACCVYLEKMLNYDTCIDIAEFANEYACLELEKKAIRYIYHNFSLVCTTEAFLNLEGEQIFTLIQSDDVIVGCETEIYDAICAWIVHNQESRLDYLALLFRAIRGHQMPPDDVEMRLKHCPLLEQNTKLQVYFQRVYNDLTIARPTVSENSYEKPRKSCIPSAIYVAGGYNRQAFDVFECYNTRTKKWTRLMDLSETKCGIGLCVIRGKIYAVGGRNTSYRGSNDVTSIEVYDRLTDRWRIETQIPTHRGRLGVAVLDSKLYAVGGSRDKLFMDNVERYDSATHEWTTLSPIPRARVGIALVGLDHRLFAIGGYDGQMRCDRVDMYQPIMDEWTSCSPLNNARSGAGVGSYEGRCIYVVGGFDGTHQLQTIERYDISIDSWDVVTTMTKSRSALGVTILGDKLYILGGFDGNEFLPSVESYDIKEDIWNHETDMSVGRSGLGVTVGPEPITDVYTCAESFNINNNISKAALSHRLG